MNALMSVAVCALICFCAWLFGGLLIVDLTWFSDTTKNRILRKMAIIAVITWMILVVIELTK